MRFILALLLRRLTSRFRSNADLEIELLVARQQLAIYQRSVRRPRLRLRDRLFWCGLSRLWSRWKDVLVIVKPATVIAWRRRKFRQYWAQLSGRPGPGRPPIPQEIQDLIRQMSAANVLWDAPRIKSELHMLGIDVAKSTVERYLVKRPQPASPTWRAFRANHVPSLVSIDFLVVPTVRNHIRYVFVVLAHLRRRIRPLRQHGAPDRGVDGAADRGGVPLGRGTALPDPRPRLPPAATASGAA